MDKHRCGVAVVYHSRWLLSSSSCLCRSAVKLDRHCGRYWTIVPIQCPACTPFNIHPFDQMWHHLWLRTIKWSSNRTVAGADLWLVRPSVSGIISTAAVFIPVWIRNSYKWMHVKCRMTRLLAILMRWSLYIQEILIFIRTIEEISSSSAA